MNLFGFIRKDGCECLNGSDDCNVLPVLTKGPEFLESEEDEEVRPEPLLKGHGHVIWQLYKKPEGVFVSTEF